MVHRRPRENWSNLVVGLTILGLGVVFWLDHMERIDAHAVLRWWPVVLVALGLAQLAQRQWVAATIWLVVGLGFLFPLLGYHDLSMWRILGVWPLLFSVAGVTLMAQAIRSSPNASLHALAVMGGNVRRLAPQEFTGGDAIAIMGGCEIDLGSVRVTREAVIDVLAFWGGIEIRVPRGWRVVSHTTTLLGAYTDLTEGASDGAPQLVLRGSVIMGGLEVRNTTEVTA